MKIIPNYKKNAFIVPGSALEIMDRADRCDLTVLLYVLSNGDFDPDGAADELGISENDFISSVKFWEESGVLAVAKEKHGAKKKLPSQPQLPERADMVKKKTAVRGALPSYTTEETAAFLERNKKAAGIIDSCENIIGKIFTTAETGIVIGMMDHLSLSGDYILLLFAHAARIGKRSVRYVEKMAITFVDRDITTYRALEEELTNVQLTEDTVKSVRKMFGLGNRALIAKEKEMVHSWCVKWKFTTRIIEMAYEITISNTKEASLSYANAILERWHNEGLCTEEKIKAELEAKAIERNKSKQPKSGELGSSYDTDDFFDAAITRSYGED